MTMMAAAAHAHAGATTTTTIAGVRGHVAGTMTTIVAARGRATTMMTAAHARGHATTTTTIAADAAGAAGSATPKAMPRRPVGGGKAREVAAHARAAATTMTTTGGRVRAVVRTKDMAAGSATRGVTRRPRGVAGKIDARRLQGRWPTARRAV
jgi:hypothetical protein